MYKIYYKNFIIFLKEVEDSYNISKRKMIFFKNYYGVDVNKFLSLQEIGDENKLSKERVRQSIEDVKRKCISHINEEGRWFKEHLKSLNKIIYRKLPVEKERLIDDIFNTLYCSSWVLYQKDIFGIDQNLIFNKINGKTFIFKEGYQSIKLSPFKEKQALKLNLNVVNNKVVDINKMKKKDISILVDSNLVETINITPLIASLIKKEIIKNGIINIENFIKDNWNYIENITTIGKISNRKKTNLILDIIETEDDIYIINKEWLYSINIGRNVMIRCINKFLSVYKEAHIKQIENILIFKTNIKYLPSSEILLLVLNKQKNIYCKNNIVKINNESRYKYTTNNEEKIIEMIQEKGEIMLSSYDSLWATANQSILFYKKNNGCFTMYKKI